MGALSALVDAVKGDKRGGTIQPPADAADLQRRMNCPACHRRMDTHFYGGPGNVVIDSCENCCLTWLDGGELTRIARAPEQQFESTETFLTSTPIAQSQGGDFLTDSAANVVADGLVLGVIDSLFRG